MRRRLMAIGAPCGICGKPIDYDLDWWVDPKDGKRKRHPMSFEYDHVVSRRAGGDNSFGNAQAAHRICNQRAGAKLKKRQGDAPKALPTSRAW